MIPRKESQMRDLVRLVVVAAFACALMTGLPAVVHAEPGAVVWYDLLSEDASAAGDFYTALFGWEVEKTRPDNFVIRYRGRPIAGISQIKDKLADKEESQWLVGIEVANVKTAVKKAKRRGATMHEPITDAPGYGRYAVIADPQGAAVMLVELEFDRALGATVGPGAWVWTELWTHDLDAAAKFYADVIGFERGEVEVAGNPYHVFTYGGDNRAGLVKMPVETIDPAWAPYVGVEDLAATLARTSELGGRVLVEPRPDFAGGKVALIADPAAGALFVYQLKAPEVTP